MRIAFGNDHAANDQRDPLIAYLRGAGHTVADLGHPGTESVDYPDYAGSVARAVAAGEADLGVLICGSGIGMAIAANKVRGIRAALCLDEYSAEMARRHNDANVVCLRARGMAVPQNEAILGAFLRAEFEEGRHARRVAKIRQIEDGDAAPGS